MAAPDPLRPPRTLAPALFRPRPPIAPFAIFAA
jgi:hypothetical protein